MGTMDNGCVFRDRLGLTIPVPASAADGPSAEVLNTGMNALWVMLSAVLVLFMQAGFILLESGSTRMKNAGHIAGKTVFTVGLCSLVYWAVGYGLIFGSGGNGFIGWGISSSTRRVLTACPRSYSSPSSSPSRP